MHHRAFLVGLALALTLAGCKREPDFNERYDTATKSIVDRAKEIDSQIQATGVPPVEKDATNQEQ